MENLIYPKPSELTFDMSGWSVDDTMFKDCTVRVQGIPSTTKPIATPSLTRIKWDADMFIVSPMIFFNGKYPNENKTVTLELYSFPVRNVEVVASLPGSTSNVSTYYEDNALATELGLGKLTMASILEYEPITRRLPGNIKTATINVNISREYNVNAQFLLIMHPAPGVILKR